MTTDNRRTLRVLLADDDVDDRFFFERALVSFPLKTELTTVVDGSEMLNYLVRGAEILPDIIFTDLNMPKVNGFECLINLKNNKKLSNIPVIIYSTWVDEANADVLFENGAHYYVRKSGMAELKRVFQFLLCKIADGKMIRPERENFVLNL